MSFNAHLRCAFCQRVFHDFGPLGEHVKSEHNDVVQEVKRLASSLPSDKQEEEMGKTLGDVKKERGVGGPPMLHGSDVPRSISKFKIKVKELREAPAKFNSPAILDLADPVYECEAMGINITNLRSLAKLVGLAKTDEDVENVDFDILADRVKGKTFDVYVSMTNNPKSKKMVRSLFFQSE